jgi:hypothetical protein
VEAAELGTFEWELAAKTFTGSQRLNDILGLKEITLSLMRNY